MDSVFLLKLSADIGMFLSIYILHYRLETHITTRYVPSRACSGLYDQILDLGAQNG